MNYQILKNPYTQIDSIGKNTINGITTIIPIAPANTDYANFKKAINEETAELQDADGNTMTAAEAKAYIATLP